MIALIIAAAWGLIPPILDKLKNKFGAIFSIFAGISPYLSILAIDGKINFPEGFEFLILGLLAGSAPAFILSAILYSKSKSKKARNAAYIGVVVGAGTNFYIGTLLGQLGAA
jgi:CDP-diglyceride synthetase